MSDSPWPDPLEASPTNRATKASSPNFYSSNGWTTGQWTHSGDRRCWIGQNDDSPNPRYSSILMTLTGQAFAASRTSFSKPGSSVLLASAVSCTVKTLGQIDSHAPQAIQPSTMRTYIEVKSPVAATTDPVRLKLGQSLSPYCGRDADFQSCLPQWCGK